MFTETPFHERRVKVVFRADGSVRIGIGHVTRCITLAKALRDAGCDLRFVLRDHEGAPTELLAAEQFKATLLPATRGSSLDEDYAGWLGVPPAVDAEETVAALTDFDADLLVVDHYALGLEWERQLRGHVPRVMAIDDLANRAHDCDVLLDQNFVSNPEERYDGLVPERCVLLAGPRYALLRPEYPAHRHSRSSRLASPERILVFFGGSDLHDLTATSLEALSHRELAHFEVDVVVTKNYGQLPRLKEQVARRPLTTLHQSRQHLADLMASADIGIGAAGTTTWERMCVGLPSVVVAAAENQRPSAEALDRADLIRYAGVASDVTPHRLFRMIVELAADTDALADLSERSQLVVDGLGTSRVLEVLRPSAAEALTLRLAGPEDMLLYFNWANEPKVRESAVHTEQIEWKSHKAWFAGKLADPAAVMLVMEANALPVGQIRFDVDVDAAKVSYSIDPIARGRGWGTRLIAMGAAWLWRTRSVRLNADVRAENVPSLAAFTRLGFTEVPSALGDGFRSFLAEPGQITANGMDSRS